MPKCASHEIAALRRRYHERLVEEGVIAIAEAADGAITASNADASLSISRTLACLVAAKLHAGLGRIMTPSPEAGFAKISGDFLRESISTLAPQDFQATDFQVCDSGDSQPRAVFRNMGIVMVWTARPEALRQLRPAPAVQGAAPARRVAVTAECLPERLACLAHETPGLECVYHFALPELFFAVEDYARRGRTDLKALLTELLIAGRIKDISALPELLID